MAPGSTVTPQSYLTCVRRRKKKTCRCKTDGAHHTIASSAGGSSMTSGTTPCSRNFSCKAIQSFTQQIETLLDIMAVEMKLRMRTRYSYCACSVINPSPTAYNKWLQLVFALPEVCSS